jgi:hypothetical protein
LIKKYVSNALLVAVIIGFILIVFGFIEQGKGLIFGTIISIVNFILMGKMLPLSITGAKRKAFLFSLSSITIRYCIIGAGLVLALKLKQLDFIFVVLGIFMIQFIIFLREFLNHIKKV